MNFFTFDFNEEEKLAAPSFLRMTGGRAIPAPVTELYGSGLTLNDHYEEVLIDRNFNSEVTRTAKSLLKASLLFQRSNASVKRAKTVRKAEIAGATRFGA